MLKKIFLISCLSIFSFNVCNSANADIPPAGWNYKSVNLINSTPESVTITWASNDPSTGRPFSFIANTDPITLDRNKNMNVPITKLIDDADATFTIIASSTASPPATLCVATFQGEEIIDIEPKFAHPYRCAVSVSGDGMLSFTISSP
ncbi:MAG: hypothetical protein K0S27_402 [Gammaproteobacteria bacterium]|jgi:hypothetical protein|nr:hypothetical protein [Gammaproteobacteria bacterium]